MKRVFFDGDAYLMVLPPTGLAKKVYQGNENNKKGEFLSVALDHRDSYTEMIVQNFRRANYQYTPPKLTDGTYEPFCLVANRFSVETNDMIMRDTSNCQKFFYFRPCLIPLDRENKVMAKQFAKDNPNGTILSGGSFLLNGDEIRKDEKRFFTVGSTLELLDSDHYVRDWIVWNGWLYAAQSVLQIQVQDLQQVLDLELYPTEN